MMSLVITVQDCTAFILPRLRYLPVGGADLCNHPTATQPTTFTAAAKPLVISSDETYQDMGNAKWNAYFSDSSW
jgi:hypothetical protein